MKKHILVSIFILLAVGFVWAQEEATFTETKYNFNQAKQTIKVYINDFKNSSQETQIDPSEMAGILKDTLKNRKDIIFSIATIPNEADMIIDCDIKKFEYREIDPIDSYMGSAALIMDILVQQNYAMMEAEFNIKDLKVNRSSSQLVKSKFNKSNMPRHESYPFIMKEVAKDFIKEYFYPKSQKSGGVR